MTTDICDSDIFQRVKWSVNCFKEILEREIGDNPFHVVFEELAFRGYLYNQLRKVTSDKNTIIATAFLFALIHFSFLSLIWIFPFGLLLGYFRKKYNTLWLGMIIHFIHNFIVLMLDYYFYSIS